MNIEGRGEPGSYPAAVKRVTELMPALVDDMIKGMPTEQKPKLENMITIWERGNTFPAKMLSEFKSRLSGDNGQQSAPANVTSASKPSTKKPVGESFMAPIPTRPTHTPVGNPPERLYEQKLLPGRSDPRHTNGTSAAPTSTAPTGNNTLSQPQSTPNAPPADVHSILAALQKAAPAAPTSTFSPAAQPPAPAAPAPFPPELAALFNRPPAHTQSSAQQAPFPYSNPAAQSMPNAFYQASPAYGSYPPQQPPSIPQPYAVAPPPAQPDPLAPLRGILPANILNDQQKLIPALQLLQDLQKDGIPPDKWGPVIKAFEDQYQAPASTGHGNQPDYGRSRARSRSPERGGGRGRGSPVYGSYDSGAVRGHTQDDYNSRNGGSAGRARYRQRSPIRDSPGPPAMNGRPMQAKYIAYDNALPPNNIKVLSRTLFVGGANGTQQEIQSLFERFGRVQTCIANREKRHAFVKMTSRTDALTAKAGMEEMQTRNDREIINIARQTKWGVGFGPRECCDYARGESIIPIYKLTEADMKWLLTAEYGGTGGQKVEGGMVLEEPDIEIGAGVSSKAMSKRVGPENAAPAKRQQRDERDRGGARPNRQGGGGGRHEQGVGGGYSGVTGGPPAVESYGYARPEPVAVATPPAVPGFGFSLGLPPANGQGNYR